MAYNRTLQHFTSSQELATVWASGQNYIVNQLVLDNDKLYRCNTAHTSGATFAGDSAYWTGLNQGGIVDIAGGGTGQTTATAAFDALAPTTTAGDFIVYNGTDNIRLPVGSDGQTIIADSSQTNKLKWATIPQGNKNYITYSNFENNATTGWSLFNTTLTSKIPTGSITAGAASLNALAVTAVTPLAGLYSLSVTSPAAVSAGQGFITSALSIDREDQAKVLTFSFYYEVVSGGSNMNFSGTSSNTWAVYIAEVNPATPDTVINWIQPAGVYGMTQSAGAGLVTGTFQTSSTGTAYRVAVVCVTASAGAISMEFDDFKLGPQTAPIGPVVVDMSPCSISTAGFNAGTAPTIVVRWGRIGDSIRLTGNYVAGGAGIGVAGDFEFFLPFGWSFDLNKISGGTSIGSAEIHNAGAYRYSATAVLSSSNSFKLSAKASAAASGNFVGTAIPEVGWWNAAYDQVSFEIIAPISGWSSNVQLSNDTDTRVVAFRATRTSSQSFPNAPASPFTVVQFDSIKNDTHGAWDSVNYRYTVPVSGFYDISARFLLQFAVATAEIVSYLVIDGVPVALQQDFKAGTANGNQGIFSRFLWNLNAGQTVQVRIYQVNSGGGAISGVFELGGVEHGAMYVNRLSGPSVVAASETVAARYSNASGQSIPNNSTTAITGWTRDYDTHTILNTASGVVTIPISGKYTFSVLLTYNTASSSVNNQFSMEIQQSGSVTRSIQLGAVFGQAVNSYFAVVSGLTTIHCNAGDTVTLVAFQNSGAARVLAGGGPFNHISIVRVGN